MSERACTDCRFCLLEDYGYSNYTVEGTTVHCLKRLHPEREGFDRWYGDDERLRFAAQCAGFAEGEPVEVDVEQEETGSPAPWWHSYIEDEERRELMKTFEKERHA